MPVAPPAQVAAGALAPFTEAPGLAQLRLPRQEVPGAGPDPPARASVLSQYPDPREEEKYPTWKRTLARRARESQVKRFCRAQVTHRGERGTVPSVCPPAAGGHVLAGAGLQVSAALLSQAIQRRLEEIEVTFRELEQQGIKLEKLLRDENGKARVDGAL